LNGRQYRNKSGHGGDKIEPLLSTETHGSVQIEFTSGRMNVAQELQGYPHGFHVYASGPENLVQQVKRESQRLGQAFFRESFTV
jgi:ferredoxin-NADP reductase